MKTKYTLFFILISITSLVTAQEKRSYLDTLKITIDNKLNVVIAIYDTKELTKTSSMFDDISLFQSNLAKTKDEIPVYKNYLICYISGESLVIREGENKKSFIVKENSVEPTNLNNELFIQGENYKMYIFFGDIADLIEYDLKSKIEMALKEMPDKGRFAGTFNFSVKDTAVQHLMELDRKNGSLDVLVIKMGIGAGIIKNQPMNDFAVTCGIMLPRNGILKYNGYLSVREFLIYEGTRNVEDNTFLNLGFRVNTTKNIEHNNWMGVELGYNLKRESDFFGKNTFVFGTIKEFGKFTISTELYFSDNFKNYYPGIRVEFDF